MVLILKNGIFLAGGAKKALIYFIYDIIHRDGARNEGVVNIWTEKARAMHAYFPLLEATSYRTVRRVV